MIPIFPVWADFYCVIYTKCESGLPFTLQFVPGIGVWLYALYCVVERGRIHFLLVSVEFCDFGPLVGIWSCIGWVWSSIGSVEPQAVEDIVSVYIVSWEEGFLSHFG